MEQLENFIPPHLMQKALCLDLSFPSTFPTTMREALDQSLLRGGKRLRPLLVFLMGKAFGIDDSDLRLALYARSIELVHSASLAHDDVIDEATQRRGAPSLNKILGNKKSILAGDYLLGEVIVQVCQAKNMRLVQELSCVIQDLAYGEWLQLDLINHHPILPGHVEQVALKKTASVMSWCCIVAPILSNSKENIIESARDFGREFGLAFQLVDDMIDMKLPSAQSGKNQLQDLHSGTVNRVILELLQYNSEYSQLHTLPHEPWWTKEQLDTALNKVHCLALSKVEKAKAHLCAIMDETNPIFFSFIGLLDELMLRLKS